MGEVFKKPVNIRKLTERAKGVTIPPDADLEAGDEATMYYNGFVLIVPKGTKIDEDKLKEAVYGSEGQGSESVESTGQD